MTPEQYGLPDAEPQPDAGPPSAKPLHSSPRIQALDVLRGLAVLLALFISVWFFGGFSQNAQNGLLISSKGFDYRLFGAIDILFDGKMRALIALVFGAAMLLFLSKEPPKGEPPVQELFIRRQMWLILFGIINGLLLFWTRDVLFHLGIMGILLFPFLRMSAKGLLIAALAATLIYCGKYYWNYADDRKAHTKYAAVTEVEKRITKDTLGKAKAVAAGKKEAAKKDTLTKKQQEEKSAWEGIAAGMKYDLKKDSGEKKEMGATSYASLYNYLMPRLQSREAQWTYQYGIWDFAGAILLGMALFRLGFFNDRFSRSRYLFMGLAGLTVGILLGWYRLHYQQLTLQDYGKYIGAHSLPYMIFFPLERLFAAVGYASLVIFLLNAGILKPLWRGFANAGRLALTNYLMQSIVCALVFTGFGAGYFGRLTQGQLYLFALQLCVVQTVFSTLWLRVYSIGPAEWLWRSLTHGKRLPFKRRASGAVESPATALS